MAIDSFQFTLRCEVLSPYWYCLAISRPFPDLFAAPPQPPDDSRRLYDRVMEEFRHKDYDAALAGFRFFLELHRSISPIS